MPKYSTLYRILCAAFVIALGVQCISARQASAASNQPLKVGFVTSGPITDHNWNQAHNEARLYLEKELKGRITTSIVENVPESGQLERVLEKMVSRGDKLIFCTSYGYLEPTLRVAKRHPDVIFMQCQRHSEAKNVGTYFASSWEPYYVAGYTAGLMTKKNKLGFVGGQPVPLLFANANAFALGAKASNPKAKLNVVWINSWYDPINEAEATKGLIDLGADVVTGTATTVVTTAEREGAYSVGSAYNTENLAPKGWLCGQVWNWGPLYVKLTNSVLDNKWKTGNYRYSLKDGYVAVSPFGKAVTPAVRAKAQAVETRIKNGELSVFKGPLKDQQGHERVAQGKILDSNELETTSWLLEGVQGSVGKN